MSDDNSTGKSRPVPETAAERKLPVSALQGSDQKDALDRADRERAKNPDTELHFGGDAATLYNDGLNIEESSDLLYGAHGTSSGIKP